MVTVDKLLENYRRLEISERDKGAKFERLMKNFLLTNPVYRGKFSDVWLWSEFPFRDELGTVDLGIDIVCKAVDGEFWAVQCKFYAETSTIDKAAVDTFLATSSKTFDGGKKFSVRLWISTSDNLTDNAEITLQNQTPEVLQINLEDLRAAEVDWEKLDAGKFGDEAVTKNFLRDYQSNAIQKAHEHYKHHDRGKLIMACGTGKTFTALKIAEKLFPDGKILFLVPSITLIKQTLVEWARNSDKPFNAICVCSDETVANRNDDEIRNVNLPLPPTTDPEKIFAALNLPRRENFGMTVIFSTYQSLEKVADTKIEFDLIICDEAHRTTGSSKDSATQFTAVHDENFIHGKKRLYMTATPRMYTSDAKTKAAVNDITLWSMDDTEIYGKEFFGLDFGKAVEKNLLSDYKVIVLTVNEKFSAEKKSDDDRAKIDGCINALSKKMIDISQELAEVDPAPMHTAVAFCPKISASKVIAATFNAIAEDKKNLLDVHAEHVDGTQAGSKREKNLRWLKNTPSDGNACRILTNVRCLSEGVDVPALDAVIFMSAKKSRVEIVQAVGRVMRKAQNKKYGYIIIPVVVPLEKNPEDVLSTSKTYDVIWEILNALRAHDKRVDIFIEEIKLNKKNDHIKITRTIGDDEDSIQIPLNFGEWQDFLYARMVERVGNRRYWEQWAKDIAEIAERHIQHIKQLIENNPDFKSAFNVFIQNLNANLNSDAGTDKAVEMLAHHLISRPVFDAIFENYSFVKNNPVSQSLEEILSALDTQYTPEDSAQLEKFYNSVRERCAIATSAEDKQKVIIELYDKFFRMAVPKTVERLGIVYTPVEVVDFILRSVDAVLKKNFNRRLTDKNVHVLDPFAGTGTFLVRLIQSGLIRTQDLQRKYFRELHANELVLLAYYIAAVNIENAFHGVAGEDYRQFPGICLTDTFQAFEQDENSKGQIVDKTFRDPLEINSARVKNQLNTRIEIIVGNPPYSVGQKSANDNNQNTFYPKIEARIAATYAAKTSATNKNALYDSYIKAFR
ncbi:MAG: DEAD/DEAH box helicase, partial [Selenomonadaceae bacterium]|nr:DEAD/DEAH box helicase [Selenomonadaceae bacterium]